MRNSVTGPTFLNVYLATATRIGMPSTSPETHIGKFVSDLSYGDLPNEAVETITRAFIDTVAVTLAGTAEGAGRQTAESASIDPNTDDVATLLGVSGTGTPETDVLRTGTASHALDYDDLSWAIDGHPSVTLVPPLLALADETDASGRDLIAAYASGFETECAIAGPISPNHYEAGWHATATFGTFGAAMAAAKLLNLDVGATKRALNIAASMPAGIKRNFGSMTKPLHAGLCSRSGITAAHLAADGFTADTAAISGDRGFWDLYGPYERDAFSIGDSWAIQEDGIHVKAYPCCYFTHTAIAGAQALVDEGIDPKDVDHVEVLASQGAADALQHKNPSTGLEGKFSMEYTVASAIVRDRVGLESFQDSAIDETTVQQVRERVDFTVDHELSYDSHVATVRIDTGDTTSERRQENPPGTHHNPLTTEELRSKYSECAEVVLAVEAADRLYDILSSLPEHDDIVTALTVRG